MQKKFFDSIVDDPSNLDTLSDETKHKMFCKAKDNIKNNKGNLGLSMIIYFKLISQYKHKVCKSKELIELWKEMADGESIENGKEGKDGKIRFTKKQTKKIISRLDSMDKVRLFSNLWFYGLFPNSLFHFSTSLYQGQEKSLQDMLEINRLGFFTNDGQPPDCEEKILDNIYEDNGDKTPGPWKFQTEQKPYLKGFLPIALFDKFKQYLEKKGWIILVADFSKGVRIFGKSGLSIENFTRTRHVKEGGSLEKAEWDNYTNTQPEKFMKYMKDDLEILKGQGVSQNVINDIKDNWALVEIFGSEYCKGEDMNKDITDALLSTPEELRPPYINEKLVLDNII